MEWHPFSLKFPLQSGESWIATTETAAAIIEAKHELADVCVFPLPNFGEGKGTRRPIPYPLVGRCLELLGFDFARANWRRAGAA